MPKPTLTRAWYARKSEPAVRNRDLRAGIEIQECRLEHAAHGEGDGPVQRHRRQHAKRDPALGHQDLVPGAGDGQRHAKRDRREQGHVEGRAAARDHDSQDHAAEHADRHPGQGQLHDLPAAEARPERGGGLLRGLRGGGLYAAGRHQPMSETPYLMTLYMIAVR